MTAGGSWPFPPGRALTGWWRELSARQPQRFWFTHLLLHRVEALAEVLHVHRPDSFELALLRLLATADGAAPVALDQLQVDRQLLSRWLNDLARQGLLRQQGPDWQLTDAGHAAATTGAYTRPGRERRTFCFVDQRDLRRPAEFIQLLRPAVPYPTPGVDFWFDPHWLAECVRRPPDWKGARQFPADVRDIVAPAAPSWREVVLDHSEHLPVAVILTSAGVDGFQVQTDDWKVRADEPVFTLGEGWEAVLPELAAEPSPELWRAAFQTWCRQRSLPAVETEAAALGRRDYHLEARVPVKVIERLRTARSDVFYGEAWLVAGTGRTRTAACLKVLAAAG